MDKMRNDIFSVSITDEQTRETIREAYDSYGVLLEPHGAVGWAGLQEYLKTSARAALVEQLCVSLETAHPAKFPDEIMKILSIDPPLPESLKGIEDKPELFGEMPNDYRMFKKYLQDNF
jgi:threonine synthase